MGKYHIRGIRNTDIIGEGLNAASPLIAVRAYPVSRCFCCRYNHYDLKTMSYDETSTRVRSLTVIHIRKHETPFDITQHGKGGEFQTGTLRDWFRDWPV